MANRLFVSTRKGLFVCERRASWQVQGVHFLGDNVTLCLSDHRDGRWYVALNLGHFGVKLKSSADAGATWEDLAVPAYPEGLEVTTWDGKPPVPATLKLIWALEAGTADQPGRLWAGTAPGGLFRSEDRGASWEMIRTLWDRPERARWFGGGLEVPAIHSICFDPRHPRSILISASCGGVWRSDDDAATWELLGEGIVADYMPPELAGDKAVQDVHRLVLCPGDPDCLWAQHHNGIFGSRDGGRTFQRFHAEPSSFGFAVVVHPQDPNRAWFFPGIKDERRVPVGGSLCVTHTRDGGQSFEEQRRGLPQEHAYDLVLRHAMDIDSSGDSLAFGSTTGNLWISDNGGQDWTCLSHHLPPIHAVRFG